VLRLLPITPALETGGFPPFVREVVTQSLALLATTRAPERWGCFLAFDDETLVGTCAYTDVPRDGVVEIAYFTFPDFERRGWAGRMAAALVERARQSGEVRVVRAHTLPARNASTAILERLGFGERGTVEDADEGPAWRWELVVGGALDARVPEPELMNEPAQVLAYARADFAEPHGRFIEELRARLAALPPRGRALDLGCGPGDVVLRFLVAFPGWRLDAVDGATNMLELAREAAADAGFEERVRFVEAVLPDADLPAASYDLVFSNSLLHHLSEPAVLWDCVRRWARPGAAVFVMDLLRPADVAAADALVARHAAGEPDVLRRDFRASLLAAFRPDEVRAQLATAGLGALAVEVVSDRHLLVWGTRH